MISKSLRFLGVLAAILLTMFPIAFAGGVQLITTFTNGHDDSYAYKITWHLQSSTYGNKDITQFCTGEDEGYDRTINARETETLTCKIEDTQVLGNIDGTMAYADIAYIYKGKKYSSRLGEIKVSLTKDFISKYLKDVQSVSKPKGCAEDPNLCSNLGEDYFCFLKDPDFEGITPKAAASILRIESNRKTLSRETAKEITVGDVDNAAKGCLHKGISAEFFKALIIEDNPPSNKLIVVGSSVPQVTYLGAGSKDSKYGVTAVISNMGKEPVTGNMRWVYKKLAEPDDKYVPLERCSPGAKSFDSASGKFSEPKITVNGETEETFYCGETTDPQFPFPQNGPWMIKVSFLGYEARMVYGTVDDEVSKGSKVSCSGEKGVCSKFVCEKGYAPLKGFFTCCLGQDKGVDFACTEPQFMNPCCVLMDNNVNREALDILYLAVGTSQVDCRLPENIGKLGPDGEKCCLENANCVSYDGVCLGGVCGENNECSTLTMPICSARGCDAPKRCDDASSCKSADEHQGVCEMCFNGKYKKNAELNPPQQRCCGDGTDDLWCNTDNGACVNGVWFDDHCEDEIQDCDETGIDCGGSKCGLCPKKKPDVLGTARLSIYEDINGNGRKDSDEDLLGGEPFSVILTGSSSYSETKAIEASGAVEFASLRAGTYVAEFVSGISNWRLTTARKIPLDVSGSSAAQGEFGVKAVDLIVECDSYDIVRGVSKTYTCTAKFEQTLEPAAKAKFELPVDDWTYSGISDEHGVIKITYDPKAQSLTGAFIGIPVSSDLLASAGKKTSVLKVSSGKSKGSVQFSIRDKDRSVETQTGPGDDYWFVDGCSETCAENGPCAWYRDQHISFDIEESLFDELCSQHFVQNICQGINLITQEPFGNKPSEIDEDGCDIGLKYTGSDSLTTGKICPCQKKPKDDYSCYDPDGTSTSVASVVELKKGGSVVESSSDRCIDNAFLEEYVCYSDGTGIASIQYDCTETIDSFGNKRNFVCQDNTCVKDCTRCGWLTKGIADWTCDEDECAALGSHCKYNGGVAGFGSCSFK